MAIAYNHVELGLSPANEVVAQSLVDGLVKSAQWPRPRLLGGVCSSSISTFSKQVFASWTFLLRDSASAAAEDAAPCPSPRPAPRPRPRPPPRPCCLAIVLLAGPRVRGACELNENAVEPKGLQGKKTASKRCLCQKQGASNCLGRLDPKTNMCPNKKTYASNF